MRTATRPPGLSQNELELLRTLEYLNNFPIPSGMVSDLLPKIFPDAMMVARGPELKLTDGKTISSLIRPNFLHTRNVGVWTGPQIAPTAGTTLDEFIAKAARIVVVAQSDNITLVPGPRGLVVPDFHLPGKLRESTAYCLSAKSNYFGTRFIRGTAWGSATADPKKFGVLISSDFAQMNPSYRIVLHHPLEFDGNIVYGGGLDNNCGMSIALRLIQCYRNINAPVLFVFTDNEEGNAEAGRFSDGAYELDIALRQAGFQGDRTPIIDIDGLDGKREVIDDGGKACVAWNVGDGKRGCILPRMAAKIQQCMGQNPGVDAVWYDGYVAGSDDWRLRSSLVARVGVRGYDWHHCGETPPYANWQDMAKLHRFLMAFIEQELRTQP